MFYLVYKITNLINNKIYIGVHKTHNKNDGYMGSGKLIKRAIKKYGLDNFKKEIIFEAVNSEEMFEKEREFVEIGHHSYNISPGGNGGFDYINSNNLNSGNAIKGSHKFKFMLENDESFKNNFLKIRSETTKKNWQNGCYNNRAQVKGPLNHMYGKIWIYNPNENKSRVIDKLETIPEGWIKGRK
jgi:hypothetical protein